MGRHSIPLELDIRDPNFPIRSLLWAVGVKRDMKKLIATSKREVATSRVRLKEIDRILACR